MVRNDLTIIISLENYLRPQLYRGDRQRSESGAAVDSYRLCGLRIRLIRGGSIIDATKILWDIEPLKPR